MITRSRREMVNTSQQQQQQQQQQQKTNKLLQNEIAYSSQLLGFLLHPKMLLKFIRKKRMHVLE